MTKNLKHVFTKENHECIVRNTVKYNNNLIERFFFFFFLFRSIFYVLRYNSNCRKTSLKKIPNINNLVFDCTNFIYLIAQGRVMITSTF